MYWFISHFVHNVEALKKTDTELQKAVSTTHIILQMFHVCIIL